MSESLIPYAVAWQPLREFWGSRNVPEVERIKNVWKTQIAENADIYSYMIQNGAPTLAQALDQLCAGQIQRPDFPSQYAYALEILCVQFGTKLPNAAFSPVEETWLEQKIDPVLKRWGLSMTFTISMLTHGAWPLPIPAARGVPFGGALGPDELEHALMVMRSASPPAQLDRQTMQALGDIRGWLETASSRRAGLVCFYY
jgi:hypothetical protein